MNRTDVTFRSAGITCAAWHYTVETTAFETSTGRPCVVMAHGFSGHPGCRTGGLRRRVCRGGTRRAALRLSRIRWLGPATAHRLPRPAGRLPCGGRCRLATGRRRPGTNRPMGYVVLRWARAARGGSRPADRRSPLAHARLDGIPVLGMIIKSGGIGKVLALTVAGLRDRFGRRPRMLPAVGPAGSTAVITKDGAVEDFLAAVGPSGA